MKTTLTKLVISAGYRDMDHFLTSAFHPQMAGTCTSVSVFFAGLAYYFNVVFGIVLPVGIGIVILTAASILGLGNGKNYAWLI